MIADIQNIETQGALPRARLVMFKRIVPSFRKRFARLFWPAGRGIVRRDGMLYLLNLKRENWYDRFLHRIGDDHYFARAA